MKKKLIIASLILASASPAWAYSENRGGVNGNGVSNGMWCYSPLPIMSPNYSEFGGHEAPCWAGHKWA